MLRELSAFSRKFELNSCSLTFRRLIKSHNAAALQKYMARSDIIIWIIKYQRESRRNKKYLIYIYKKNQIKENNKIEKRKCRKNSS